jgi:hypothetical protein
VNTVDLGWRRIHSDCLKPAKQAARHDRARPHQRDPRHASTMKLLVSYGCDIDDPVIWHAPDKFRHAHMWSDRGDGEQVCTGAPQFPHALSNMISESIAVAASRCFQDQLDCCLIDHKPRRNPASFARRKKAHAARGAGLFNFGLHRGHRSKIFWVRFGQNTRVRLSVFLSIPSSPARAATASSPGGTDTPRIWLRFGQNTWDRLVDLLHQSKYDHDKQP